MIDLYDPVARLAVALTTQRTSHAIFSLVFGEGLPVSGCSLDPVGTYFFHRRSAGTLVLIFTLIIG